jgi:hypothetical protein
MKRDIEIPEVKDIAVAIVHEKNKEEDEWSVYLLNLRKEVITNVFITSKGYGEINGEWRQTSTLRHFFQEVRPKTAIKVEPIMDFTFGLSNEYWVSFYIDDKLYDKQYVFLPETISPQHFTAVPLLNQRGVMIR